MLIHVEYLEDSPQLIMKQHMKGDSRFRPKFTTSSEQGETHIEISNESTKHIMCTAQLKNTLRNITEY